MLVKTIPVDLNKLSDVVDNEVVKNTKFSTLKTKVKNLENKIIPDAITLIHINQYNTDKQNLEEKSGDLHKNIPNLSGLETTTALNAKVSEVENKLADASSLVTTTVANTKISEVENKTPDYDKYITTQEFNKLFLQNFTARLKEANLVSKTDFHNKLTSFHRKNTLNKKNI